MPTRPISRGLILFHFSESSDWAVTFDLHLHTRVVLIPVANFIYREDYAEVMRNLLA